MNREIAERISMIKKGYVPKGYKKVKKYILPVDWEINKLGDLVEKIQGGGTPPREVGIYYNGDIPWATVKDLGEDNYKSTTIEYITDDGLNNSSAKLINKDSFIISTRMGLGRGFINAIPMAINQDLKGIYPNRDKLNVDFLMYWYKSISKAIEYIGGGSTVKGIDLETLKKLELSISTTKEQKRITDILMCWDKAIELKEKLLIGKRRRKKGLMERLLTGKVRLKGYNEEWSTVSLGSVLHVIKKEALPNPQDYNLLTVKLHVKGIEATDKSPNATEKARPYYLRESGELLIGRQNFHNGGIGIVPKDMNGYIASNAISSLGVIKGDLKFYFYYLSNTVFYKRVDNIIGGTGQKEISEVVLKKLKLTIPKNFNEQVEIAKVLSIADKEIKILQKEISLLKQQKKGLMQLLLTGIIRVDCN